MKYIDFDAGKLDQRIAVIDGDGIAWAIGWNHKEDVLTGPMFAEVDFFMHDTLQGVQAANYSGILSPLNGKANFRYTIEPNYKGNRKERPDWYKEKAPIIEDYLVSEWGFVRGFDGYEADDFCASLYTTFTELGHRAILVHTDKDMNQLAGEHFNPVKKMVYDVYESEAFFNLYKQIIMGDSTDNIKGIPGWGEKAAEKALAGCVRGMKEQAYMSDCLAAYCQAYGSIDKAITEFYANYKLCRLETRLQLTDFESDPLHGYDLEANQDYNKASDNPEQEGEIPQLF